MSNFKLKLLIEPGLATEEEHIYAKVIQQSNVDEHLFLLWFTDVPPKAMSDDKPFSTRGCANGFGSDAPNVVNATLSQDA
ncbi:MAG: hypothetical protein V7K92_29505 [Nostoc sp.]|uniref:hypothetical protein n=1 Tax=Nostoc sp. TaxID=1180 RepID=UPI002FEFE8A0